MENFAKHVATAIFNAIDQYRLIIIVAGIADQIGQNLDHRNVTTIDYHHRHYYLVHFYYSGENFGFLNFCALFFHYYLTL